jgi:hypothetical protein
MTLRHGQRVSLIHPDGTVCIVEPTPKQFGKCHIVITAPKEVRIERDKESADEIEQLRKERDEARRMWCVMRDGENGLTCKEWAERKNWDCFKENTDV